MLAKEDLAAMLTNDTAKPVIRRGQGMRLSTEAAAAETTQREADRTDALTHNRTNAKLQERTNVQSQRSTSAESHHRTKASEEPKRINRGYKLREDLIKACKRIALDEDRHLYEVMEEALEQYVKQRRS